MNHSIEEIEGIEKRLEEHYNNITKQNNKLSKPHPTQYNYSSNELPLGADFKGEFFGS